MPIEQKSEYRKQLEQLAIDGSRATHVQAVTGLNLGLSRMSEAEAAVAMATTQISVGAGMSNESPAYDIPPIEQEIEEFNLRPFEAADATVDFEPDVVDSEYGYDIPDIDQELPIDDIADSVTYDSQFVDHQPPRAPTESLLPPPTPEPPPNKRQEMLIKQRQFWDANKQQLQGTYKQNRKTRKERAIADAANSVPSQAALPDPPDTQNLPYTDEFTLNSMVANRNASTPLTDKFSNPGGMAVDSAFASFADSASDFSESVSSLLDTAAQTFSLQAQRIRQLEYVIAEAQT